MKAKTVNFERGIDPKDAMDIGGQARMKKRLENFDIMDLIYFLDDFSELKKYRDPDANWDSPWYENIPLKELLKLSITEEMLNKITDHTGPYDGWMAFRDEKVTLGGGA